jgi:6,7-dimethyl-8-ribityllumazine synthase
MPLIVQALLKKDDVDAVVTLGAIVRGDTKHDEVIAHAIAGKLIELSLHYRKPVTLGIAGPGMTRQQAKARVTEYADRSVNAAIKMALIHKKVNRKTEKLRHPSVIQ